MSQFVFSPYLFFILLFPSVFVVSFKKCFLVDFLLICFKFTIESVHFLSKWEFCAIRFFHVKEFSSLDQQQLLLPQSSPPSGRWCVRSCRWAGRSWRCWRAHLAPCLLTSGTAGRTAHRSPRRTGRGHGMEAGPSKEDLRSQHTGV